MNSKEIYIRLKNFLERLIAFFLFLLFLPIITLIYFIIKLDSPGSPIFRQIRIGRNQKPFLFYKFRTMSADARKKFPELYRYEYTPEEIKTMRFKLFKDPRHTKFGEYLRKTSLDELPNLINVIRGEMSLIGPRPEIPEMLKYYRQDQMAKFSVLPGITGYAQVSGRGLLTFQETIVLDLKYVKEQSFLVDLKILAKTCWVIIQGIGAF